MLKNGSVLDGKYEILKQIGEGGFSKVYLAMNQRLNQQWVIKEIEKSANKKDMTQVMKEANLMKNFDHPAIPRIVDILDREDGTYIIMDYVSGQSLAHELKVNGPQPQEVVIEWAKQICNVLVYLHSLNPPIVYHDLKPGNIILKEPEKTLKLLDFGEARPCINGNAPGGGRTQQYAAPEQQKETRGNTDERTDIYCFGTTIYRLLTGQFPPKLPEPVGSIRERFPELQISKGMDNIIRKCTQIDPKKRFQSAAELAKALDNIQLWDEDYLKRLNNRIRNVVITGIASVVLLATGIGFNRAAAYVNSQNYNVLVETQKSETHETKVANYKSAIEIDGADTRAYECLTEAYEDNGTFGTAESQELSTLYNQNKDKFDMTKVEYAQLNYEIGRLYFNMYTGDNESFRERILKAHSYFQLVAENSSEEFENYKMAKSYYTLCDFFKQYVLQKDSVNEPVKEDYENMMAAVSACLTDMQNYEASDAAYTRLNLYSSTLDMLNVNIKGLTDKEIPRRDVETLIEKIGEAAAEESVTQEKSLEKQEHIVTQVENILDNVEREYDTVERRNKHNG